MSLRFKPHESHDDQLPMSLRGRLLSRLRALPGDERGMALPFALFAMIAGMALTSAAVVATINVQQGSHRDSATKGAIAVADAGANIARSRIDRYAVVLAGSPCLRLGSSGVLEGAEAEGDGWCPAVTGTVGSGEYSYRVSPAGSTCGEYTLCVVSTGTVGEASRRVEVAYNESAVEETRTEESTGTTETSGSPGFEGLIGEDGVEVGGNADVHVGVGSNGDVIGYGENEQVCGDVRTGVGKKNTTHQCAGYQKSEGNKTLPPVSSFMPSDIATNNSDSRLGACTKTKPVREPTNCELDSYTGTRSLTEPWNAKTRAITLSSKSTLTVSGGDYWVCSVTLSGNSQLIMGVTAQARFFFDTPEHCGLSAGATQLSFIGNTRIASSNPNVYPAFYFLGSPTMETKVYLGGNAGTEDEFVVYGPNTNIEVAGKATYKGVIAGKTIKITGNGRFENDSSYRPPSEITPVTTAGEPKKSTAVTARYYSPQFYVECAGAAPAGAAPNSSC
jgi:hypothetical protein